MSVLSCPRCNLRVPIAKGESAEGEVCPRCLARTSGALSVQLAPVRRTGPARHVSLFGRLLGAGKSPAHSV
jgi:hypothetical protein